MASRNIVQEILEIQARKGRDAAVAIFGASELHGIMKRADRDGDPVLKRSTCSKSDIFFNIPAGWL
jgi:hypothetical protein